MATPPSPAHLTRPPSPAHPHSPALTHRPSLTKVWHGARPCPSGEDQPNATHAYMHMPIYTCPYTHVRQVKINGIRLELGEVENVHMPIYTCLYTHAYIHR